MDLLLEPSYTEMEVEDEPVNSPRSGKAAGEEVLQSRAYQIEMLEQALQQNVVVASEIAHRNRARKITGKGLQVNLFTSNTLTSATKRIWFCAPSVVLAQQQHSFLSTQLAAYRIRLITGLDNARFWTTQAVWDAVLDKINVVVSTPQILLDALSHGFVSLRDTSLLVFDEAHHCISNAPMALIMQRFYHSLKRIDQSATPHILGLTASPVTSKASMLKELEANMDSVCKTPTFHVQDYRKFVHLPVLERIPYAKSPVEPSVLLRKLREVVSGLTLEEDPTIKWLRQSESQTAVQKLAKILESARTPVMKQMESLKGHSDHICENVGSWAADVYLRSCAQKFHDGVVMHELLVPGLAEKEQQYIDQKLQLVLQESISTSDPLAIGGDHLIAPKTRAVMKYLIQEYRPGITAIVFVQRRSVAYALTRLFQSRPQMKDFQVFSFVGAVNPANRALVDLADKQIQNEAFADFREGKRNLCVATQVMEEGVDIQATNLVIRFDEPQNFRSFVQSRGRARQPDSRFVMVHEMQENDTFVKLSRWKELEQLMKSHYSDLTRDALNKELLEEEYESGNEFYRVDQTGALLSYDNARQHLEHFCTTLPQVDVDQSSQATFVISDLADGSKSARVVLPSCVPSTLQQTTSLRRWRTERMAKKDAAFQTYKALHTVGLLNDNLLPFSRVRLRTERLESRDSFYEVRSLLDPWTFFVDNRDTLTPLWEHLIEVTTQNSALPPMNMLLPLRLDHKASFSLQSITLGSISVSVTPSPHKLESLPQEIAHRITSYLFQTILGRRLKEVDLSKHLPYLIMPGSTDDYLTWLEHAQRSLPLTELCFNRSLEKQCYLLKHKKEEILYKWTPSFDNSEIQRYAADDTITAERLTRQLSFIENKNVDMAIVTRSLSAGECLIEGLSASYADFMLLIPSISYMLTLSLRGQLAVQESPLRSINFHNSELVTRALTSSSALSNQNFEALEFLGDSLLKFYASVQVFFDYPLLPEGGLSAKYSKLVNNARLQRATKDLGLDQYITVEPFSGQKWSLALDRSSDPRKMSSKTLADVIEALVGAAYLDERNRCDGKIDDALPVSALSVLVPEGNWRSPVQHVSEFINQNVPLTASISRLCEVESMIGYKFTYASILMEALTRATLQPGQQSFQRLEFLGDAVLDRIVNAALYDSAMRLDPEHMKNRQAALVNRWLLAFLALEAHHIVTTNEVTTDPVTAETKITQSSRPARLIDHMKTLADRNEVAQRQRAETTFSSARDEIMLALELGDTFPWPTLLSVDTSKSYSDLIEAILAAVFIDSGGSLSACESVLESLGLMKILRRMTTNLNFDVIQPTEKLMRMYQFGVGDNGGNGRTVRGAITKEEREIGKSADRTRRWICRLFLDGEAIGEAESAVGMKHAETCAAAIALKRQTMLDTREDSGGNEDGMIREGKRKRDEDKGGGRDETS